MECERRKEYKYEYRIPLTTDKTFSDFERIMKLIDRKAKIDAGLPDRTADMWSIVFWIIFFNYIDRNSHKFTFSEETNANIKKYLEGDIGKNLSKTRNLIVANKDLFATLQELKNNPKLHFEQMMDLTAVDYLNHNKPSRFQIVYNLLSLKHQFRVRVKCALADGEEVKSIVSLWLAADWYERDNTFYFFTISQSTLHTHTELMF